MLSRHTHRAPVPSRQPVAALPSAARTNPRGLPARLRSAWDRCDRGARRQQNQGRPQPATCVSPTLSVKLSNQVHVWSDGPSRLQRKRASTREPVTSPSPKLGGGCMRMRQVARDNAAVGALPESRRGCIWGISRQCCQWKLTRKGTSQRATSKASFWRVRRTPGGDSLRGEPKSVGWER